MTKAWLFEALGEELSDEEVRCYAIAFAITSTKLCGDEREAPSPQAARNVMDRAAVVRSETARRRYGASPSASASALLVLCELIFRAAEHA
jgi:hypothetical protein